MLYKVAHKQQVPLCIYRVSCAYGFNKFCPDQGVLNKWIFDGLLHRQINLYNSLDSTLNFISYDQLSIAFDIGITQQLSGLFNIGTTRSTSLRQIYDLVVSHFPGIQVNNLGSKTRRLNIDCSKFKDFSGCEFQPEITNDFPVIYNTIFSVVNPTNSP